MHIFFKTGILVFSMFYLSGCSATLRQPVIDGQQASQSAVTATAEKRVHVSPEELPIEVTKTLNEKSYTGWKIFDAFLVTVDNGPQYYELVVRKADEESRMKVDGNGQILN